MHFIITSSGFLLGNCLLDLSGKMLDIFIIIIFIKHLFLALLASPPLLIFQCWALLFSFFTRTAQHPVTDTINSMVQWLGCQAKIWKSQV